MGLHQALEQRVALPGRVGEALVLRVVRSVGLAARGLAQFLGIGAQVACRLDRLLDGRAEQRLRRAAEVAGANADQRVHRERVAHRAVAQAFRHGRSSVACDG